MSIASNLLPYRKAHSLSEAVLSIFLVQEIVKPERFETLILEDGAFHNLFDEFRTGNTGQINFNLKKNEPEVSFDHKGVTGFIFRKFHNGQPEWVINYNKIIDQVPYISIHCLNYTRWDAFLKQSEIYLNIISEFDTNIYVSAYGLNNIDQFNWIGDDFPNVEEIFNVDNEYIPLVLKNCNNSWSYSLNHIIQKQEATNDVSYIEKIDIYSKKIIAGNINIGIIHNTIKETDISLLKDLMVNNIDVFRDIVCWSHKQNKNILEKLLTKEVQNLINLTSN